MLSDLVCCGTSSSTLLDSRFDVRLPPDDARKYLTHRENWKAIIPGAAGGVIDDSVIDRAVIDRRQYPRAWTLTSSSYSYLFSNIVVSDVGAAGLCYDVRVRGVASGLPIDFSLHVEYTFDPLPDGCRIRRHVQDLVVHRLRCILGGAIESRLRKGLAKENATMVELMNSASRTVAYDRPYMEKRL